MAFSPAKAPYASSSRRPASSSQPATSALVGQTAKPAADGLKRLPSQTDMEQTEKRCRSGPDRSTPRSLYVLNAAACRSLQSADWVEVLRSQPSLCISLGKPERSIVIGSLLRPAAPAKNGAETQPQDLVPFYHSTGALVSRPRWVSSRAGLPTMSRDFLEACRGLGGCAR